MSEFELKPKDQLTDTLITIDDVASILSISTRTVWRKIDTGKIPTPIRLDRQIRWKASEIQAFIDNLPKYPSTNPATP